MLAQSINRKLDSELLAHIMSQSSKSFVPPAAKSESAKKSGKKKKKGTRKHKLHNEDLELSSDAAMRREMLRHDESNHHDREIREDEHDGSTGDQDDEVWEDDHPGPPPTPTTPSTNSIFSWR